MPVRLALWVLWTALTLCLPAAARLELCLCDGPQGLFDGAACGMAVEGEAPECCCAPAEEGEPRLEPRGERRGCVCVTLDVQRSEPALQAVLVPAIALRADAARAVAVAPQARRTQSFVPRECARPRQRVCDGLPLRI